MDNTGDKIAEQVTKEVAEDAAAKTAEVTGSRAAGLLADANIFWDVAQIVESAVDPTTIGDRQNIPVYGYVDGANLSPTGYFLSYNGEDSHDGVSITQDNGALLGNKYDVVGSASSVDKNHRAYSINNRDHFEEGLGVEFNAIIVDLDKAGKPKVGFAVTIHDENDWNLVASGLAQGKNAYEIKNLIDENRNLNILAGQNVKYVTAPVDWGHVLNGEVKPNGWTTGGHSLVTGNVRMVAGTSTIPNALGVYKAKVEIQDPANPGVWRLKSNNQGVSTLFPSWWTADRIKVEVEGAYQHLTSTSSNGQWKGTTPSGVKVVGFVGRTVYPDY